MLYVVCPLCLLMCVNILSLEGNENRRGLVRSRSHRWHHCRVGAAVVGRGVVKGGGQGGPVPLQYLEKQNQVHFLQTHDQGLHQLLLTSIVLLAYHSMGWGGPGPIHILI